MGEVASEGRTVFFVSHNMAAVSRLCSCSYLLQNGSLLYSGPTGKAVEKYYLLTAQQSEQNHDLSDIARPSWARRLIKSARILDTNNQPVTTLSIGSDITIEMGFDVGDGAPLQRPDMGVVIHHTTLGTIGAVSMRMANFNSYKGVYKTAMMRCVLNNTPILPGRYIVDLWLGDGLVNIDMVAGCTSFIIEEADIYGSGIPPMANTGVIYFNPKWNMISSADL